MLDLTQLRTFVAVVQEGHLTRAAERLHISQPTASNHIRIVEAEFGLPLFHRTTRGLDATPAGLRLAEAAGRVLGPFAELNSLARSLRGSPSGRLVVGTVEDPGVLAKLPLLTSWMREHQPLVELAFESRHSVAIRQGIAVGELDAGFFVADALDPQMEGTVLKALEFVVAGPAAWRQQLAAADRAALAAMPWVVTSPGTAHADLTQRLFAPLALQVNAVVVVSNDALLRAMIRGGMGVGFIRRDYAEEGEAAGAFAVLPDTLSTTRLLFGYTRVRRADALVAALASALRAIEAPPAPG